MKIILLEDIKALGRAGEVKSVADGYARNFLIPKRLAKAATSAAIEELKLQQEQSEKISGDLRAQVEEIEKITAVKPLIFKIKVGDKGEIWSSISENEIRERLLLEYPKLKTANLKIETGHLKELGRHEIEIKVKGTTKDSSARSGQVGGKIKIELQPQTSPLSGTGARVRPQQP